MNKHYCFTDVHGNYNLWRQVADYCDDTDVIYFLGDAADRGEDGLQIIQELLRDKRVVYLKGNHEDIFVDVGAELAEGIGWSTSLWRENGGKHTINSFKRLSYDSQIYYIKRLAQLPTKAEYVNTKGQTIIMTHAGFTPGRPVKPVDFIWDRKHMHHEWPQDKQYKDTYIIHGHTPVQIQFKSDSPIFYCDEHKIDLDMATFVTNKIALLDLDTLEIEKIFEDKTPKEEK